jgi:two-component system, OmpR family, sensor kinase
VSARPPGVLHRTRLRLPIRLKLAVVSAGLTFVILALFALVVGGLTEQRIKSGFNDELRATAADLQERFRIERDLNGTPDLTLDQATLDAAASGGASIRVIDRDGRVLRRAPLRAPDLGPPTEGGLRDVGEYRVVSRPLFAGSLDRGGGFQLPNSIDGAVAFVQYARPRANVQGTIDRLHFFLALGILGGTGLAFLAGFAVARRAMRPIAGLTDAAREVARTRDPAMTLPKPQANDEVARLADTLEDMLRELDAARTETEAALERQREFVADASHELRTPLTSILANLELLEDDLARSERPDDREAAAEIAGSALRSSRRMRRLVGDLLLLARADAGREAPRRTVDLSAVVREAAAEAAPLASGHDVSFDLPGVEDPPAAVEGSPDDLHRLALNLIENALIHTPSGTPVVASVRHRDGTVRLEVSDRGPGVPAELRERVFERFARREGDRGGNSGLGLAIVRAVAEAHGGSVEVGDASGGGAVFTVELPVAPPHRSVPAGAPDPQPAPKEAEAR